MTIDLTLIERGLQTVSLASIIVLTLRLAGQGLHRTYRCFFAYLLYDAARGLVALLVPMRRSTYAYFYIGQEPLLWLLYFLIVRELYNLVLREHPGIATISKLTLSGGMVLATAISLLTIVPDLSRGDPYPALHVVNVFSRAIMTTLVFFLLIITTFLVWYPVPLNQNSVYYCVGYTVFFFSKGLALLLRNLVGPDVTQMVSAGNLVVASICTLIWIWKLNRKGELRRVTIGHAWRPEEAERLMAELASINQTLLRTARR